MFSRWSQENFFRYLIMDYDFDKLVSFGTEPVDPEKEIVNPQYRKITHQLKKLREKIQRLEARFFPLVQLAIDQPLDDLPAITSKQIGYRDKIEFYRTQEEELKTSSPMGEAIFQIIAILKAMEVNVLRERTIKGIEAARARGLNGGRPEGSYNKKKASAAVTLYKQKNSINFIEDNLNISRSTIYQYLRNEGVVIKGFKKIKNN